MALLNYSGGGVHRSRIFAAVIKRNPSGHFNIAGSVYADFFDHTPAQLQFTEHQLQELINALTADDSPFLANGRGTLYVDTTKVCQIAAPADPKANGTILFDLGNNRHVKQDFPGRDITELLARLTK